MSDKFPPAQSALPSALFRGDAVDGAEQLQPSFADAMARAGATR
jgi:hypothetical protein